MEIRPIRAEADYEAPLLEIKSLLADPASEPIPLVSSTPDGR